MPNDDSQYEVGYGKPSQVRAIHERPFRKSQGPAQGHEELCL